VNKNTFAAVVVPAVLQKLPETYRLSIRRGAKFLNCSMEELLNAFLRLEVREQLELGEDHYYSPRWKYAKQEGQQHISHKAGNRELHIFS